MLNLHGSLFALRALVKPGLIVPGIKVDTIARLDFAALRRAGYTGAVFDRDNCLDAWTRCKSAFGSDNVLIVSNSAGTSEDPLGIQTESLSFNLGVPVLRHARKKPACGDEILAYFRRLQEPRSTAASHPVSQSYLPAPRPDLNEPLNPDLSLITSLSPPSPTPTPDVPSSPSPPRFLIIGDRLTTDILLARTLPDPTYHLPIWTTHLWSRPDLPLLRFLENSLLRLVLWSRNQTFRDGVVEKRAPGETWDGREGWISKIRRFALGVVRRVPVQPEPVPPRTNELGKFVVPVPTKLVLPLPLPTTRMEWVWYYSRIGARFGAKGIWIALAWSGVRVARGVKRGWAWIVTRVRETRAKQADKTSSVVETKT